MFADNTWRIDTVIECTIADALRITTHIAITGTTGATGAIAGTICIRTTGIRGGDTGTGGTATEECKFIMCSGMCVFTSKNG